MKRCLILFWIIFTGCLGTVTELYPEDEELRPVEMYVVSHGWHVGIAIESAAIDTLLPDHEKMPEGRYLKFGWGDNRYYPDSDPGFGLLLRAALLPTRSVVHVVGIDIPVENYFGASDIIRIQISEEGAGEFGQFISSRFRLDEQDRLRYAAEGLYTNSEFFEATGYYYFPKTSNKWTARALRETGFPITPFYAFTSGNVIQQARKHGEVIQQR